MNHPICKNTNTVIPLQLPVIYHNCLKARKLDHGRFPEYTITKPANFKSTYTEYIEVNGLSLYCPIYQISDKAMIHRLYRIAEIGISIPYPGQQPLSDQDG
jgi:hypothetical protein